MNINDILGLGETSTKLLDVVAKGIGTAWSPIQIRLEASAKAYEIKKIAEAVHSVNDAQKSIEYSEGKLSIISDKGYFPTETYTELSSRITDRAVYQQLKKQLNLENTIYYAQEELASIETVSKEPLDEDWITRFFNIAEDVSNEQMQHLWGRILAGEVKKPKSFSLRTLETLRNLSPLEANVFQKVSMYAILNENTCFIIKDNYYIEHELGINFGDILLLSDLGLISSQPTIILSFKTPTIAQKEIFSIGNTAIIIEHEKGSYTFDFDVYAFTTVGKELLQLLDSTLNESYIKYLIDKFKQIQNSPIYRADLVCNNGETTYENLVKQ